LGSSSAWNNDRAHRRKMNRLHGANDHRLVLPEALTVGFVELIDRKGGLEDLQKAASLFLEKQDTSQYQQVLDLL
jgi:hypothetical protein